MMQEMRIPSTDNIHSLYVRVYEPECEPVGIIQVVHGMIEHIERYDEFMSFLASHGFLVFGHNHLGHKWSSEKDELGFIAHKNGDELLVNDTIAVSEEIRKKYPGCKYFLFGHSMGSFVVRLAAAKLGDALSGLIVCGTGGPNPASDAGLLVCDIIKLIHGERYISKVVSDMAFSSYNSHFPGEGKYAWLWTDNTNEEEHSNDEYCQFSFTVSAMHDLVSLNKKANSGKWFSSVKMPILLISGSEDPVGNYGKGVKKVYSSLIRHNPNTNIKLYEKYRHEILNDTCKNDAFETVLSFIKNQMH